MANQDLIYSILPRAPAAPGSDTVPRDVRAIAKKPHIDPSSPDRREQSKQQAKPQARPPHQPTEGEVPEDPPHQIDLFV